MRFNIARYFISFYNKKQRLTNLIDYKENAVASMARTRERLFNITLNNIIFY